MPTTPALHQPSSPFSTFSSSSHYHQDSYHHPTSTISHWDGTLPSRLSRSIHRSKTITLDDPITYQFKLIFNSSTLNKSPFQSISSSHLKFLLLCSLWYTSSAISSNTGKIILNQFKFPITLTIVQSGFVAIWFAVFIYLTKGLLNYPKQIIFIIHLICLIKVQLGSTLYR
ncbi:hypothetical protein DFH28DRAFT_1127916 [Melampsora americana]|nr:hypothetical protein DFH28DRAFT_1127916 [Melampsora americana]